MMQSKNFEKVSLTNQTDRGLIPVNQSCERYVLLTLQAPTPPRQADRLPLNLSLVIDRSGSMSGHKLRYVKEAASHVLRLLTPADRASVVIYDDEVELLSPSRTITADVQYDLIRRLQQVRTGGMTNLSGGWFSGCDQIANHMRNDYLNRALLLTDGLANVGMTDHEALTLEAKELRRRGISTTTFGVGHDFNQFLLQGIADGGGGHFYFIDQPDQIPNYFEGELGELLTTVAREMTLEINLPAGVQVDLLNDVPYEQFRQGLRIFLGEAYAGERRLLVLKLKVPPVAMGRDVALSLSLRYEDVQQRQPVTITGQSIHFTVAETRACETQPVDEYVLSEAGRMEAERAKMEALQREYRGDVTGARQALYQASAAIAKVAPAPQANAISAELADLAEDMSLGMTDQARKAKHYSTYQAQRSRRDYKK